MSTGERRGDYGEDEEEDEEEGEEQSRNEDEPNEGTSQSESSTSLATSEGPTTPARTAHLSLQGSPATPPEQRLRRSADPSPQLVRWFRNPKTLSPNIGEMRKSFGQLDVPQEKMGKELSQRSRRNVFDASTKQKIDLQRKREAKLKSLGETWIYDPKDKRAERDFFGRDHYAEKVKGRVPKPIASPTRSHSLEDSSDRFEIPLSQMSAKKRSKIFPQRRESLGPLPSTGLMRRSYSMDDLQDLYRDIGRSEDSEQWSRAQMAFVERLRAMDRQDQESYTRNRDLADPQLNKAARKRMTNLGHPYLLREKDRKYLSSLREENLKAAHLPRGGRKQMLSERATLNTALPKKLSMSPIQEEDQDSTSTSRTSPSLSTPATEPLAPERSRPRMQRSRSRPWRSRSEPSSQAGVPSAVVNEPQESVVGPRAVTSTVTRAYGMDSDFFAPQNISDPSADPSAPIGMAQMSEQFTEQPEPGERAFPSSSGTDGSYLPRPRDEPDLDE